MKHKNLLHISRYAQQQQQHKHRRQQQQKNVFSLLLFDLWIFHHSIRQQTITIYESEEKFRIAKIASFSFYLDVQHKQSSLFSSGIAIAPGFSDAECQRKTNQNGFLLRSWVCSLLLESTWTSDGSQRLLYGRDFIISSLKNWAIHLDELSFKKLLRILEMNPLTEDLKLPQRSLSVKNIFKLSHRAIKFEIPNKSPTCILQWLSHLMCESSFQSHACSPPIRF